MRAAPRRRFQNRTGRSRRTARRQSRCSATRWPGACRRSLGRRRSATASKRRRDHLDRRPGSTRRPISWAPIATSRSMMTLGHARRRRLGSARAAARCGAAARRAASPPMASDSNSMPTSSAPRLARSTSRSGRRSLGVRAACAVGAKSRLEELERRSVGRRSRQLGAARAGTPKPARALRRPPPGPPSIRALNDSGVAWRGAGGATPSSSSKPTTKG